MAETIEYERSLEDVAASRSLQSTLTTHIFSWLLVLSLGGILLRGRFFPPSGGWTPTAEAAYNLSFFLFVLLITSTYYVTRLLARTPSNAPLVLTGVVFVLYAFPYRWLGLDRFRHVDVLVPFRDPSVAQYNHLDWFPGAFVTFGFLRDFAILATCFLIIAAVAVAVRGRLGWRSRELRVAIAVLGTMFLQAALHTGMRSPYTYLAHFQPWDGPNVWYHAFLLPHQGLGIVELDEPWFLMLDNLFKGVPDASSGIFMRPVVHYIASPFSYFIDTYDVFLVLNVLLWFAAAFCTYDVVKRVCNSPAIAIYAGALVVTANGFIYYVAQPMSYLAYYASVIVLIFFFERVLVEEVVEGGLREGVGRATLFGVLLGLLSLTYDFFPMYPMILAYATFRRVRLWRALLACVLAAGLYFAYQSLYLHLLPKPQLPEILAISMALNSLVALFREFSVGRFELLTVGMLTNYVQSLAFAFAIVAFLLAVLGAFTASPHRKFAGIMLIPSFLLNVFFYYAGFIAGYGVLLISLPRLMYIAYPATYTLAAIALDSLARYGGNRRYMRAAPWAIVACIAIINNIDVFGIPALTYHFVWPGPSLADGPLK